MGALYKLPLVVKAYWKPKGDNADVMMRHNSANNGSHGIQPRYFRIAREVRGMTLTIFIRGEERCSRGQSSAPPLRLGWQ